MNENEQCFPDKPCPTGFEKRDEDETDIIVFRDICAKTIVREFYSILDLRKCKPYLK
ncbi:MAG TPA: hypothetical protein VKA95_16300 [Nitrososphaeraceae archaeon]|nr:hypothetical protein [Nitrososphaeraceae archaeon]